MKELRQKVAQALSAYARQRLAVGVSGGRDSVCLLHAVVNCGAVNLRDIAAVHVNHCLRDEADSDEAFVRELCARLGVRFISYRVDVRAESRKNGLTIEQAARNLRYGIFAELIKSGECDVVLTAHHALDNAETVLMHMFRGSGLDGLRGIAECDRDRHIVRPLINVFPDEIDGYCADNGLDYVVDKTNLSDEADRNFIRLNVIPLIERRYAGAVRAVTALAGEAGEACDLLDAELDPTVITFDRGAAVISDGALGGGLAKRYVRQALKHFTLTDITREQIERTAGLVHMRMGATVELSGGIVAAREYGGVAVYVPRAECASEFGLKKGANFIDGLAFDVTERAGELVAGRSADYDKLGGATVRFRRDGDTFTPYGGGRKKLKQYFIDNKVPKRVRDRIPLICRGSEVLAVVGMQISDGIKITERTATRVDIVPRWL